MIHPTQRWLFRPVASLALKIHQPLPLNPREAHQLLNLLTTSFRQQLEREYESHGGNLKATSFQTLNHPSSTTRHRNSQLKKNIRGHTDHHLHSILTNPLFSHGRGKLHVGSGKSRDPMDVFDDAYARGLMTVEYAGACLAAKKRIIVQSAALSVRDAMKTSGAGLKVLRWLESSGTANETTFLHALTPSTSRTLVQFLAAEEQQTAIWNWLDRLFVEISNGPTVETTGPAVTTAAYLLRDLVTEGAAEYGSSLDAPFASFRQANDRLVSLRCPTRPILAKAGSCLSHEIWMNSSSHILPSPAAYDSFLELVSSFTYRTELYMSQLLLHHPTNPVADLALEYLGKVEIDQDTPKWSKIYPASRIISLGLDTARYLLEREQHEDAKWVMEFLQKFYAKPLGLDHKREFNQAKEEASSLELLDSLNLA